MKAINKLEPVKYIVFNNGSEIKYDDIMYFIKEMKECEMVRFDTSTPEGKALFDLFKTECNSVILKIKVDKDNLNNSDIIWIHNRNKVNKKLDELVKFFNSICEDGVKNETC